ncbi:MAG: sulfite exporter TauE/SafE family protein [Candidatus Vogelbacteria bacterium]|nr:sulfite exporter TauE/SafE family protein [Candidatus Vogelbacteria bacterium]
MGNEAIKSVHNREIFLTSLFFVLGFSFVFSIIGVLLQTVLSQSSQIVQLWLGRLGGVVIIFFGLFLLNLFTPNFLTKEHTIAVKWKFKNTYITSFIFGAAFAVGWTPCVSAALGAILALATSDTGSAFILLFAYTLGIGIPFLLVGLFTEQAEALIRKMGKWLIAFQYFFGVILISIGILVFTGELRRVANFSILTSILTSLNLGTSIGGSISSLTFVNIVIAFFAGLGSFLSPCLLPIVPGFLSYLASTVVANNK